MICPHCGEETVKHGTYHRYQMLRCRCDICKRHMRDLTRKYRARIRSKQKPKPPAAKLEGGE